MVVGDSDKRAAVSGAAGRRIFAPSLIAVDSWRVYCAALLGLTAIALLFLLGLRSTTAFAWALVLVVLALLLAGEELWRTLSREPLLWLALALFLAVFLRGAIDLALASEHGRETDARTVWHHARYGPLVPLLFGFWLAAYWHLRYWVLAALAINLVVYCVYRWDALLARWPGGDGRATHAAFNEGGVVAVALVFLGAALMLGSSQGKLAWLRRGAGAAVLTASLAVLLLAQSRGAWLALLVGLIALAWLASRVLRMPQSRSRRRALVGGTVTACLLLALFVAAFWDVIAARVAGDLDTVVILLSGQLAQEEIPGGSFGARFRMLVQGLVDIREQPLLGVGPASVQDMLHEAWGRDWRGTGDYHNTWLTLAVAMGVPWALLWLGLHVALALGAVRGLLAAGEDRCLGLLLAAAVVAQFVALTFSVRIWGGFAGTAIYLILATLLCAAYWRVQLRGSSAAGNTMAPATAAVGSGSVVAG